MSSNQANSNPISEMNGAEEKRHGKEDMLRKGGSDQMP